jgi:carbon storage regulator
MLVLSRRETQRIRLGDSIVITVVRVAGDKVRLGIDAPRDMLVLRDELETFEVAGAASGSAPPTCGAPTCGAPACGAPASAPAA